MKQGFLLENFEDRFLKENLEINWSDLLFNLDNETLISSYEFNTILNANNYVEIEYSKLFFKYKLKAISHRTEVNGLL